jgi:hypothetical protein
MPKFKYLGAAGTIVLAEVEAATLEDAWELTNTIDRPWWENAEVTLTVDGQRILNIVQAYRSAMVGDTYQDEDGRYWEVDRVGFREVQP